MEGRGVSPKCAHNSLVISSYICKSSGSVPRRDDRSQFRSRTRQGMAFRNERHGLMRCLFITFSNTEAMKGQKYFK
ncbi:hypothetical protein CDAR_569211 [Caerostris darwini]|uniref:Uncharacterized protein n=1 Tax=Caerostris darwini TaxID=1538125 RepID=A0AAV4MST7_9ARAC|nr:hypothetical protein CDAR_569211 [Caerostris darwini]